MNKEENIKALKDQGYTVEMRVKYRDLYDNPRSMMDLYLPKLDLAVMFKRQSVSGTADQKVPFWVNNLVAFPAKKGLLVLDGAHFHKREGIHHFLNAKVSDTFNWCFEENFLAYMSQQTPKTP